MATVKQFDVPVLTGAIADRGCNVRILWVCGAVFLLLLIGAGGALSAEPVPLVQWQEISVSLDPEHHMVTAESTVAFATGAKNVRFRLSEGARVESVRVGGKGVPFSFAGGVLSLEPQSRDAFAATITYRASFNDPVSRHPAASEDPSYGVNAAVTREGTFLGGGAYWYPVPEHVPARRKVTVAAPAGMEGVTAGARISRETTGGVSRSVWQEARPVGVLSLCAGPYLVEERQSAGITLYSYFYSANAQLAPRYLDAAGRYLTLYQELFGPYPFEKFAIVENFFPTGYGFPSFTLLGGSVIRLPFIVDTSLPHEIAHSWWGNGIDVDMSEGNWCEGMVTYLADYLLKERRSPVEALEYRRQLLIDYASLVNRQNEFALSGFASRSDPASRAIGYGKAAMVFHMIRSQIGDAAFFGALRALARERMYAAASWSDLVAAFSRSAGRDIAPSIDAWLTRPGGPRLSLAQVKSRREGEGWLVTGTISQSPPLVEIGVPLLLETENGVIEKVVPVAERTGTRFAFSISSVPKRLLLDPDASIFRILSPGEIPATVNSVKGSTNLIGVVTQNCKAQTGTFRAFLASLSRGEARLLEESDLDSARSISHDLVFCGTPKNLSLLPPLPGDVDLGQGVSGEGTAVARGDGLLFLVLQRQSPSKGVVALFQPLSEASAQQYGPKVTHYGKYGYLIFSGGANRHKGTAPTSDAGVSVGLPAE